MRGYRRAPRQKIMRTWSKSLLISGFLVLIFNPCHGETPPRVQRTVEVPMRDGVILRAELLEPAAGGPFPVLVYRTPYGKEQADNRGISQNPLKRSPFVLFAHIIARTEHYG